MGTYDAELFGMGPITFELSGSTMKAPGCQEFCPDLTITEGGSFEVMWVLFEGGAKLKGGLDCASGEFRGELVDGDVHLVGGSAADAIFPMMGTLQGQFMDNPARIVGSFAIMSAVDANGTFTVMR